MFGVSVYFQDFSEQYLKYVISKKAKLIFLSLHIPEEDLSNIKDKLEIILSLSKQHDIDVVCDISPLTFSKLNLENNDFSGLKQLGISKVRLDFGFDNLNVVKEISEIFDVYINASTISFDYLDKLKSIGVDISKFTLSHNFYPKASSGLSDEDFKLINNKFKAYNLKTQAFIAGDKLRRFPIYEGLPTLESQRYLDPFVSYLQMKRLYNVDYVVVGDSLASDFSLECISRYENAKIITIKANLRDEYKYLYHNVYTVRSDVGAFGIRINSERFNVEVSYNTTRHFGSIGIDNYLYERYSGEITIFTKDLMPHSGVNNIGFVDYDHLGLLFLIKGNDKIMFKPLSVNL